MNDHEYINQQVKEQALSLPEGCSTRGKCPKCGGTTAFCITRVDSEVRFICFSASCNCRGVISSRNGSDITKEQFNIRHRKLFDGKLSALTGKEEQWLVKTFHIRKSYLKHVRYCDEDNRVYYPQFDMTGRVHGYIARYYPALSCGRKLRGAKALWKPVLNVELGLYFPDMEVLQKVVDTKAVCVVEDYPSALRINSQIGFPTCCLGGTNIYEKHISTMISLGVEQLVIILDADAIVKAVKLKRELALAFPSIIILPVLGADPKDMTVSELDLLFNQLNRK